MSRKGTCYKSYEHDSTVPIPRSTVHNRHKRKIVEMQQENILFDDLIDLQVSKINYFEHLNHTRSYYFKNLQVIANTRM